jgi:hypothetical protein
LDILVDHAIYIATGQNASKLQQWLRDNMPEEDLETFFEYSDKLTDLNRSFDINIADYRRAANWGIFQGNRPVVIDLGYTEDVRRNHY